MAAPTQLKKISDRIMASLLPWPPSVGLTVLMTPLFQPLEERQANLDPGSGVSSLASPACPSVCQPACSSFSARLRLAFSRVLNLYGQPASTLDRRASRWLVALLWGRIYYRLLWPWPRFLRIFWPGSWTSARWHRPRPPSARTDRAPFVRLRPELRRNRYLRPRGGSLLRS